MVEIKSYSPEDHCLKCLIYGAPGTGKTYFAAGAENVLVWSAEAWLLWIKSWTHYAQIKTFKDLQELYKILEKNEQWYKTFVLDSVTEINDIIINELSAGKGQMYQNDRWVLWKKLMDMFRKFRDLPLNVIFICHEQIEKDDERVVRYVPMISGKTGTKAPGYFDVVWRSYVDDKWTFKIRVEPRHDLVTKSRWMYINNNTENTFKAWLDSFKKVEIQKQETITKVDSLPDHIALAKEAGLDENLYWRAEVTYKKLLEQSVDDIELQAGKIKAEVEKVGADVFTEKEKIAYYKFIDLSCKFIQTSWLE